MAGERVVGAQGVGVYEFVSEYIRRSQRAPTLRRPAVGLGHGRQRVDCLRPLLAVAVVEVVVIIINGGCNCATTHAD